MAMTHDCMNIQTATDVTKFGEINYGVLAVYCPYIVGYHNVCQPSQLHVCTTLEIRASYYTVYIPRHELPLYFILFILG